RWIVNGGGRVPPPKTCSQHRGVRNGRRARHWATRPMQGKRSMTEMTTSVEPHGWINSETLKTRFGEFEFKGGYPAGDTAERLFEAQKLNRAIEVYLTQLMPVSEIAVREGMRAFGSRAPQQVVIWEDLMDAGTVLLTANTETVYAMAHLELKKDGPTV